MKPVIVENFVKTIEAEAWSGTARLHDLADKAFPEGDLELEDACPDLPTVGGNVEGAHVSCMQRHFGFCVHRHSGQEALVRRLQGHLTYIAGRGKKAVRKSCLCLRARQAGRVLDERCLLYVKTYRRPEPLQEIKLYCWCTQPPRS